MDIVLTFLSCFFIFLSSMKDPEWLEFPAWFLFFILSCWQNWLYQKQFNNIYAIRKLLVYCTVAVIFGYVTAGILQNGALRAFEWLIKAASFFTLAMVINFGAKAVKERSRKSG